MKRIDSFGSTPSNEWTEGNPATGTPATVVSADFMNIVQEELAYIVESAAISLDQTHEYEGSPAHNTTQLKTALDAHFVNASGDTMTGALTLSGAPTQNLHAASKQYVDGEVSSKLAKSGDQMSGTLDMNGNMITNVSVMTLQADPVSSGQAARKGYVDAEVSAKLSLSGGTMTGDLTLAGAPTSSLHAATKAYVDSVAGATSNAVNSYSSNQVLTSANSVVLVNATSGAITITLPAPSSGKTLFIKKTDSSANAVTISAPSGTIDGAASKSLSGQYDALTIVSDGTNFFII